MYAKNPKTLYILIIVSGLSTLTLDAAQVNSQKDISIPIENIKGKKAFDWIKTIKMEAMENPSQKNKNITITPERIIEVKTELRKIQIKGDKLPESVLEKIKWCPNADDNDSNEHKASASKSTQCYKFYDIFLFIHENYSSYKEIEKEWKEDQLKTLITGMKCHFMYCESFKKKIGNYNFRYACEQMLGECRTFLPLHEITDEDDQLSLEVSALIKNDVIIKVDKNDTSNDAVEIFID